MNIALEIAEKESRLAELEAEAARIRDNGYIDQEQLRTVTNGINELTKRLNELREDARAQEQEQEVRDQEFVEHIDSLQQQIQDADIIGRMLPRDEYESLFGLTEYGAMQQQLNSFVYGLLTDQQTELYNKHKYELAQKDMVAAGLRDQLRAADDREHQLARQNSELQKALNTKELVLQDTERRADDAEDKVEELQAALNGANDENRSLKAQIEQLTQQLAEAQKPKEVTPSKSLSERLDQLQPIKPLVTLNADDLVRRWEERQNNGGKVTFELPDLSGGNSFRHDLESDNQADAGNSGLPVPELAQEVTFQEEDTSTATDGLDQHETVPQDVGVTRDEFEALKQRVERIERVANLPEVA